MPVRSWEHPEPVSNLLEELKNEQAGHLHYYGFLARTPLRANLSDSEHIPDGNIGPRTAFRQAQIFGGCPLARTTPPNVPQPFFIFRFS